MSAISFIETIQTALKAAGYAVKVDGDIGRVTRAAVVDLGDKGNEAVIKEVQTALVNAGHAVAVDGKVGRLTLAALDALDEEGDKESLALLKGSGGEHDPEHADKHHKGKASFFAGPQDIDGFRRCKREGGSDVHCFGFGDNGIGKWGRDCTTETAPLAAVPREIWRNAGKTGGARLWVECNGERVEGELGDTMPALENVENGAIIDLNPGFARAFGVPVERMNNFTLQGVTWGFI